MPHRQSLSALNRMLATGGISSTEITTHFLDRIEQNQQLNAFVSVDREQTLARAQQADHSRRNERNIILKGLPVALKDIFCTQDLLTSCGSRILSNFVSPYDATVVERLDKDGFIVLGKTNMDEFAMGSSNESSYFGPVLNPWNTARVPGGSSGGSAAAVSARLAPAAIGTDTGGSIRQPAAFCGLTGLKPSYGRISRYGMVAYASSLDQAGPITQSAEDAALLLQTMAGFDSRDSTSLDTAAPDYLSALNTGLENVRLGIPKEFLDPSIDPEVLSAIETALQEFEKLGAKLVDIELPNSGAGIAAYYVIAPAEASSNLSKFDGVRYGHRASEFGDLLDMYEKSRAEGFGDEVKRRILIGTYALSAGYYDAYYLKAQKVRRIIANDFSQAFKQCDLIAGPTTPSTAFPLGKNLDDPVSMYLNDVFTVPVNLAGLPAISLPAGFDQSGLPIGLQLIGPYLKEANILSAAHGYQKVTDWHQRIPGDYE